MTPIECAHWAVHYRDRFLREGNDIDRLRAEAYAAFGLGLTHAQMDSHLKASELYEYALAKLEECARMGV